MLKIYQLDQIQVVYERFHHFPKSVLCRIKGTEEWKTPPMDTGKWYTSKWEFCFLIMKEDIDVVQKLQKDVETLSEELRELEDYIAALEREMGGGLH